MSYAIVAYKKDNIIAKGIAEYVKSILHGEVALINNMDFNFKIINPTGNESIAIMTTAYVAAISIDGPICKLVTGNNISIHRDVVNQHVFSVNLNDPDSLNKVGTHILKIERKYRPTRSQQAINIISDPATYLVAGLVVAITIGYFGVIWSPLPILAVILLRTIYEAMQ